MIFVADGGAQLVPIKARRQFWGLWTTFLAALALLLAIPHLVPGRQHPWDLAQTGVAGFVVALLSLPTAVSTFARRERLREVGEASPDPVSPTSVARVRALLLALWARCLLIGLFGFLLAYGSASPAAAWPFVAAAAVLLVFHAPRNWLFTRPPL